MHDVYILLLIKLEVTSVTMAFSDLEVFMIIGLSIKIAYSILFMGLFVRRINKLEKLAENNLAVQPKAVVLKIVLLAIIIGLLVLDIVLSYSDPTYWMYPVRNYSLVNIFLMLNFFLQIIIISKEVKRSQKRAISITIFWLLNAVVDLTQIIYIEIILSPPGVVLIIVKCALEIALIVVAFTCDKPIQPSNLLFFSIFFINTFIATKDSQFPLISQKRQSERTIQDNKLYIEFNKEFHVTLKKDSFDCQFKIAVYVDEEAHIITKKDEDFLKLAQEMAKAFPQNLQVILKQDRDKNHFQSMMKYGEERQKTLESYLIEITKTDKFYTTFLMDFLEINPIKRAILNDKSQKQRYLKKDSLISEEEDKVSKVPFFDVGLRDGKIVISNPQILELMLHKKKNEILEFHNRLLNEKRLNIELLSEEVADGEVIHFISRVANSKNMWRSFAEWFMLGRQLEDKIYHFFDLWNIGFKNIEMEVLGHEIAFDKDKTLHTLYLLSIYKKNSLSNAENSTNFYGKKNLSEGTTIKKRYSDFFTLDKYVRKFIQAQHLKNVNLPSLPPKFSPFGSKTSPKSRQIYFDIYIKELVKIQGINHCIKFLEFLEIDENSETEQSYEINERFVDSEYPEPSQMTHESEIIEKNSI